MNDAQMKSTLRPLVSVVMPVYNHATYVIDAIRSVFEQTYRPLELIIIDDGSSDGSADVVGSFLQGSPAPEGITVHFDARENRGAHCTINEGIEISKGEYVTILNSDDVYFGTRIETCVRSATQYGSSLIFTYVEPINASGEALHLDHPWRIWYNRIVLQELDIAPSVSFVLMSDNITVSTGNLFFSRQLFEKIGPFEPYRYAHDLAFVLKATIIEEPVLLREKLYRYRLHGTNTISDSSASISREYTEILRKYLESVLTETPCNPLAPGFANWPSRFSASFFPQSHGPLNAAIDEFIESPNFIESSNTDSVIENSAEAIKKIADTKALKIPDQKSLTIISHELSRTGGPVLVLEMARAFVNSGINVNILAMRDGPLRADFEKSGIPITVVELSRNAERAVILGWRISALAGRFQSSTILRRGFPILGKVVRIGATGYSSLKALVKIRGTLLINSFASWPLAMRLLKLWKGPVFWYIHETYDPQLFLGSHGNRVFFDSVIQRSKAQFLYGSDGTRSVWAKEGYDGQVRYWSGLPRRSSTKKHDREFSDATSKTHKIVLSVGTSGPRKGTRNLVEAFAYGRQHGIIPQYTELLIVGCVRPTISPDTRDLITRIHKQDLRGRVRLVGTVEATELQRYYDMADIYVQSSTMECLPLALLTAMANGLPIVTTNVDGCKEAILDGVCGLTVPPRQTSSMAEAIGKLLNRPELARNLGDAAQKRFAEHFSLDQTVPALIDTILSAEASDPDGTVIGAESASRA